MRWLCVDVMMIAAFSAAIAMLLNSPIIAADDTGALNVTALSQYVAELDREYRAQVDAVRAANASSDDLGARIAAIDATFERHATQLNEQIEKMGGAAAFGVKVTFEPGAQPSCGIIAPASTATTILDRNADRLVAGALREIKQLRQSAGYSAKKLIVRLVHATLEFDGHFDGSELVSRVQAGIDAHVSGVHASIGEVAYKDRTLVVTLSLTIS